MPQEVERVAGTEPGVVLDPAGKALRRVGHVRLRRRWARRLADYLGHNFLRNIKICVDFLHVVVIFEGVY